MPPEIPNQIITGTPYTERECFARLVNDIGNARDAARGMAQLRKDMRWQHVAGLLDQMRDNIQRLMVSGTGLIVPGNRFN